MGTPGKNPSDAHGPEDSPVDFSVTGISPIDPKKAAKLKATDFRGNFLLCLFFAPADSTI